MTNNINAGEKPGFKLEPNWAKGIYLLLEQIIIDKNNGHPTIKEDFERIRKEISYE